MKKEATLSTIVKRRGNGSYAPVAFFVIVNLLVSEFLVMLMTEVSNFCGYFNSVLPHFDIFDFVSCC